MIKGKDLEAFKFREEKQVENPLSSSWSTSFRVSCIKWAQNAGV